MKTVGVFGKDGRMGREIVNLLEQKPNQWRVVGFDKNSTALLPTADIWIDFSTPAGLAALLAETEASKVPIVSGTTGLGLEEMNGLKLASSARPILWSPNMSLGIAWMKSVLPLLAKLQGFDIQVLDFHHKRKLDSPSGTAKLLQDTLTQSGIETKGDPLAFRLGGIYGVHKVFAVSESEWITIEHSALNRTVFAEGAVLAANWLIQQSPGMYSIESMLGDL